MGRYLGDLHSNNNRQSKLKMQPSGKTCIKLGKQSAFRAAKPKPEPKRKPQPTPSPKPGGSLVHLLERREQERRAYRELVAYQHRAAERVIIEAKVVELFDRIRS